MNVMKTEREGEYKIFVEYLTLRKATIALIVLEKRYIWIYS